MTTHEYDTIEGTEPTTHGVHQPRTIVHTAKTGDQSDVTMMSEIGDGVFVAWGNCRKCTLRIGRCQCAGGPTEPPFMQGWRDSRFDKSLNTRPDPSYDLIPSVIEWLEERGYTVTEKKKTAPQPVTVSLADNPHINPDRESAADEYRELLTEGSSETTCRTCGEKYSPYGDGWDGECPDCADKTYAAEFGDELDEEPDYTTPGERRELSEWGKAQSEQKVPTDPPPIFEQVTGEKPRSLTEAVAPEKVDAGLDAALERVRAAREGS